MEEKHLCNKIICLEFDVLIEKSLQINFLDALSSLYHNIGENVYYTHLKEDIEAEIEYVNELISMINNNETDYIQITKDNTLYYRILDGLKYKIEKEIS